MHSFTLFDLRFSWKWGQYFSLNRWSNLRVYTASKYIIIPPLLWFPSSYFVLLICFSPFLICFSSFIFSLLYLFLLSAVDLKSSAILSLVELIYFSVTWQKRSLSDKFLEALCRTNYTNTKQKISYHIIFRQIPLFLSLYFHVKQFHLLGIFTLHFAAYSRGRRNFPVHKFQFIPGPGSEISCCNVEQ
jgi:hypothetical protein